MHPINWLSTIIPQQLFMSLLLLIIDALDKIAWTIYISIKDTSFLKKFSIKNSNFFF